MSAMLDMSNGRVNMAYVGETPWHKSGQALTPDATKEEWAIQAGLDWSAIRVPSGYQCGVNSDGSPNWVVNESVQTLIRDDTLQPLGQFTDRYKVVQPVDMLDVIHNHLLVDDRWSMETAGSLKDGKRVWATAKFNDPMDIMGEEHIPYLMVSTTFDGTGATVFNGSMVRSVCWNTVSAALYSKKSANIAVRHSTVWSDAEAARALDRLQKIAEGFKDYRTMAESLALIRMTATQTEAFFKKVAKYEPKFDENKNELPMPKRTQTIIDRLMESYETTVKEGTDVGNAWTAFNSITRYADHLRATRVTDTNSKADGNMSAIFGTGAMLKQDAGAYLMELAA